MDREHHHSAKEVNVSRSLHRAGTGIEVPEAQRGLKAVAVEHDALDEMVPDVGCSQRNLLEMNFALLYPVLARNSNHVGTFKENSFSVRIPGPTGHDLTRAGNIGIWHIMRWFEELESRTEFTRNPLTGCTVLDIDKLFTQRLIFIVSIKLTVGEELYKLVTASEPTPFCIEYGLHNIGTSSFGIVLPILDESGRELGKLEKQMVVIDEASRKPAPIPGWFKKKHESLVAQNKKMVVSELNIPAENTYKHTIKVSWNDIDSYQHVNYLAYVMFCFDAAMDAVKHKFYVGFFDDILKYNVKTMQVRYINEALAGDYLTVITWQDAQDPRNIHFSIERDGNTLVQVSMEFFLRSNL